MRKIYIMLMSLLILSGCMEIEPSQVQIGEVYIDVEIAKTDVSKANGLSGKDYLDENSGMLFMYDSSDLHSIWMPNMNFPIDVIWIGEGGGELFIVDVFENITPESFPEVFVPKKPAKYILEVNAGFSEEHGILNDSSVEFSE